MTEALPPVLRQPEALLLAWTAVAGGALVQGAVGFGFALVAAPLLALVSAELVPAPVMANAAVLTGLLLWRERRGADLRSVRWALSGTVGGSLGAGAVLTLLSPRGFELLFAGLILAAVGLSLGGLEVQVRSRNAVLAGMLSGFMGTASSVGGPPMALLLQRRRGAALRGTLSAYFLVAAGIGLGTLALAGRFGPPEIRAAALLAPATVLGFALSPGLARRMDRGHARPWILGLSAASALAVLARALLPGV